MVRSDAGDVQRAAKGDAKGATEATSQRFTGGRLQSALSPVFDCLESAFGALEESEAVSCPGSSYHSLTLRLVWGFRVSALVLRDTLKVLEFEVQG